MTTLRDFVVAQSTLAQGNTVREHLDNPSTGGGGQTILVDGVKVILNNDSRNQILSTSVSRTIVHAII